MPRTADCACQLTNTICDDHPNIENDMVRFASTREPCTKCGNEARPKCTQAGLTNEPHRMYRINTQDRTAKHTTYRQWSLSWFGIFLAFSRFSKGAQLQQLPQQPTKPILATWLKAVASKVPSATQNQIDQISTETKTLIRTPNGKLEK